MIQRILATVVGVALLAAVLIFTFIVLAIGLTAALVLGGWMWWRGRGDVRSGNARVIEGEYRIVESR